MPEYLPRSKSISASLRRRGLSVTAVSLGVPFFYSNSKLDLHSPKKSVRDATLAYVRGSIDLAVQLEAGIVYTCSMKRGPPEERGKALGRLGEGVAECADYAKAAAVRFALEPFPTGELPTVRETTAFIRGAASDNLGLVLDTGHAAISREALGRAAKHSRGCIAHVHLNNNDGILDLHWPPKTGKLATEDFRGLLVELRDQNYRGEMSIELSKPRPVVGTITASRRFVQDLMDGIRGPASPGSRISS
jgi:fructoselysine 3-epimerase